MRFEDVTARMGLRVDNPGGRGHGSPLNIAIPSLGNVRLWQAVHGGYSWVICHEPALPQWSEDDKSAHVGYTASYRRCDHTGSSMTIRIGDKPWDSFAKAEEACKRTWRQIRNAS